MTAGQLDDETRSRTKGWPRHGSPLDDLPRARFLDDDPPRPPWADHLSHYRRGPVVVYVAEPYQIDGGGMRELAWLDQQGWHVRVHGESLHHETTVVVELERAP